MGGAWPCYHLAPDVVRLGVPDVLEAGAPLEVVLARFAEEDRGVVESVPVQAALMGALAELGFGKRHAFLAT